MERATHRRLTEALRTPLATVPAFTVPAARYRDPAWFAGEALLFRAPQIVAASAALAPGACLPIDLPGRTVILTRDGEGVVHAVVNACRHRGTRLVDAPCTAKAFVCPYHGWTYDLRGTLLHVPHADAFAGYERRDLHAVPVVERHGLVWLGGEAAGALDADLASLGLAHRVVYRSSRTTRRCNWKLAVEAFLDGYHIRTLHRDSVYRFFQDAASLAEAVGPHVRAVTARRALREAPAPLDDGADLLALGTPSYLVFPSTIIIEHPDFTSLMLVRPEAVDTTTFEHVMLVPADRAGDTDHWAKSWALIEDIVFQREDFFACEQIQRGLGDHATTELLFGSLEFAARFFHDALAQYSDLIPNT